MRSNVWLLLLTSLVAVTLIGCHPPTSPAPACASDVGGRQAQEPAKGKAALDARAVFKQRCYRCHSGEKPKGDFDLEHIDAKTRAAEILDRITSRDEEFWMPPAKRLTVQQLTAVFAELGQHANQADERKGADGR